MFDLSQQLNAKLLTKVTFAFDSQQIMSPMCLPKTLLNEIIDENLEYILPRATPLQQSLIDVLENMKTRPTFCKEYPKAEIGIRSGKTRCERIDAIRGTDIKKILTDERLLEWWKNI